MNIYVAKVIKDLLSDLPYFDRASGLVQTITKEDSSKGRGANIRFPVEVDVAELYNMVPMIPDDSIKGMFYIEDGGAKSEGNNDWTSDLTLVCWFCPKKIAANVHAVSANALADIASKFRGHINSEPLTRLKINIVSMPVRDVSIFSKYSYSETQTQFLMPPYDFFAIKLKCSYRLSPNCIEPLEDPELC